MRRCSEAYLSWRTGTRSSNTIVNIGFATETEGKKTISKTHSEERLTEMEEYFFFFAWQNKKCLVFALYSTDYVDSFSL